jgi:putative SbcD/Mre11-related phosphoesterase
VSLEGWLLTPEGGIIHQGERTAVIADVHLGYEWARGAAGDCVPAHSLSETVNRLERLLARVPVDRLVVAGDLVESARPCRRTAADVARLRTWLDDRGLRLVLLRGNHDGGLEWLIHHGQAGLSTAELAVADELQLDGWTIVHGHSQSSAGRLILGHHHPALKASGKVFRCFLAGPRRIMLPAFSSNAAGLDVGAGSLARHGVMQGLRCLASSDGELLDFGPVQELAARLR